MIHGGPGGHILRDINYHIGQATYHSNNQYGDVPGAG